MNPRKPPDAVIKEAIIEGLSDVSIWGFKRHGGERIQQALKQEGYLIVHSDVLFGMWKVMEAVEARSRGIVNVLGQLVEQAGNKQNQGQ